MKQYKPANEKESIFLYRSLYEMLTFQKFADWLFQEDNLEVSKTLESRL